MHFSSRKQCTQKYKKRKMQHRTTGKGFPEFGPFDCVELGVPLGERQLQSARKIDGRYWRDNQVNGGVIRDDARGRLQDGRGARGRAVALMRAQAATG